MKTIKPRQHHQHTEYRLVFERISGPGGFSFECDESGKVDESSLSPAARANFQACLSGLVPVRREGVVAFSRSYWEPAVGECIGCGEEVTLSGFTNTCGQCNADYNMSGQLLAPRECWSEGTDESLADIVSIDSASTEELLG